MKYNWIVFFALFCNLACAYHFGTAGRSLPGGYDQVVVPVFKNMTHETGVETYFTNALIRELERTKVARVTSSDKAQVTVEGVVNTVNYIAGAPINGTGLQGQLPKDAVLSAEYRILVGVDIRIRRNSDQKILWSGSFDGERSYPTPQIGTPILNSSDALYNQSARYQNIEIMAQDMMSEAHDRMTENF